ncbi:MAG: hypothetical protein IPM34_08930 [Saprospiraceae bacterium]|nr:hypothetical protein [Saprospiraceae bacterium]
MRVALSVTLSLLMANCSPSSEPSVEMQTYPKELESYLMETFFFYELLRNQPSYMKDSLYALAAQELQQKYKFKSEDLNLIIGELSPSSVLYAQMLDSIKMNLKTE